MELIADGILVLAALVATTYCMVLSRRLRRLSEMDGGLGAAITALSKEVDHLTTALAEAKTATTESATDLSAQCRAAHAAARRLESLVKSANRMAQRRSSPAMSAEDPATASVDAPAHTGSSDTPAREPSGSDQQPDQQARTKAVEPAPQPLRPEPGPAQAEAIPSQGGGKENAQPVPAPPLPAHAAAAGRPTALPSDAPEGTAASKKAPSKEDAAATPVATGREASGGSALDEFIEAIIANGNRGENAVLARRLVKALGTSQTEGAK